MLLYIFVGIIASGQICKCVCMYSGMSVYCGVTVFVAYASVPICMSDCCVQGACFMCYVCQGLAEK